MLSKYSFIIIFCPQHMCFRPSFSSWLEMLHYLEEDKKLKKVEEKCLILVLQGIIGIGDNSAMAFYFCSSIEKD